MMAPQLISQMSDKEPKEEQVDFSFNPVNNVSKDLCATRDKLSGEAIRTYARQMSEMERNIPFVSYIKWLT